MKYTDEKHIQVLIALLKEHNIKKIIASPGATNITLVRSLQNDSFFEMYSAVDERSAAYMACGLAAESREPVVLTCTGATASRNYLPGLTEAFYRKLPILAVTSTQDISKVGHHIAQVLDRSSLPNDTVKHSVHIPSIKDEDDLWGCEVKLNNAILELSRKGGGPVHVNLTTNYSKNFNVEKLPKVRVIKRMTTFSECPALPEGKIAIFAGVNSTMTKQLEKSIDRFCEANDAVVFCDHTSGYYGKYRVLHSLSSAQRLADYEDIRPDLIIHIGEITGDYSFGRVKKNKVWRVSEDGELRDTFRKLECIFEMSELSFFDYYTQSNTESDNYLNKCKKHLEKLRSQIPSLPYSNLWIASKLSNKLPSNSTIHFAILNTLRSWNFFELPEAVESTSNVGGFGIDGCVSTLIGASLVNKEKLYFGVIGDLAFFYDLNSIGNRHVGNNLRILLVNNGKGVEFRNFSHKGAAFKEATDEFIAAAGHFGNQSNTLVKNYSEDLGFEYLSASNKEEFENVYEEFIDMNSKDKPIILEVFTETEDESNALETITSIDSNAKGNTKRIIRKIVGEENIKQFKNILRK